MFLHALRRTVPKRFPKHTRGATPRNYWKFERPYQYIARYNEPIVPFFGTASGLRFMHNKSEILTSDLPRLRAMAIIALPIHDCSSGKLTEIICSKIPVQENSHNRAPLGRQRDRAFPSRLGSRWPGYTLLDRSKD
jgi:hypothetical protein